MSRLVVVVRCHSVDHELWLCCLYYVHVMCAIYVMCGLTSFQKQTFSSRKASFLWTTVREPTARATSQFFHFMVSKQEMDATERNFRDTFLHGSMMDYYLKSLSTDVHVPGVSDAVNTINSILDNYDFIGITERMDESAVALMMILDIPLGDILHLSAKQSGRYDDGGEKAQCFLIPEAKSTHGMQTVIASPEWKAQVQNDLLF